MCSAVRRETDCKMHNLMVSVAILLSGVIGVLPLLAQNAVSYEKQSSDIF